MPSDNRALYALLGEYSAKLNTHKVNVEIMLSNPTSIPEHTSFVESLDKEIEQMSVVRDKIDILKGYFLER